MRFSVWPTLAQPWADVLEVSRHAEATGWDGVYVMDHFMGNDPGTGVLPRGAVEVPTLEGTGALAALAAATERVRLGTLVLGNTYRHPAVRRELGGHRRPHQRRPRAARRRRRLAGQRARAVRHRPPAGPASCWPASRRPARCGTACCASETTTIDGRYYQLTDAICEPKPVQDPLPLLIGGKGDRMLGIVARYADEWNMWGLADTIAERAAVLDAALRAHRPRPERDQALRPGPVPRHRRRGQGQGVPRGHRPPRRRRHGRRDRRGRRRVAGHRPRRGHRPRLHPRQGPEPPRPPRPHHRAGRPAVPLTTAGLTNS